MFKSGMAENDNKSFDPGWNAVASFYADDVPIYPIQKEWLDRLRKGDPSGEIADFGCGPGKHSTYLASAGLGVVGIDRSPAMLAEARRLTAEVTWVEADLCNLPMVNKRFAHGLCLNNTLGVIPGEANRQMALDEMVRVTDGTLALELLEATTTKDVHEDYFGTPYRATRFQLDEIEDFASRWPLLDRKTRPSKIARQFHLLIFSLP
jgi:SAM-dependent methyltransferase